MESHGQHRDSGGLGEERDSGLEGERAGLAQVPVWEHGDHVTEAEQAESGFEHAGKLTLPIHGDGGQPAHAPADEPSVEVTGARHEVQRARERDPQDERVEVAGVVGDDQGGARRGKEVGPVDLDATVQAHHGDEDEARDLVQPRVPGHGQWKLTAADAPSCHAHRPSRRRSNGSQERRTLTSAPFAAR